MIRRRSSLVAALACALAGVACADNGGDITTGGDARMSVLLTDAPGDFAQARVTIDEIALVGGAASEEDAGAGRIILRETPWSGDLLELQNEVAELVDQAVVPAGHYSELRFVISGGCIEVERDAERAFEGGDVYATDGYTECGAADGRLQMPSFAQSGLKVKLPGGGVDLTSDEKILLVDFVVSESFGQQAGASGMWVMHPVIHATDVELSGTLDVEIALADSVTPPDSAAAADLELALDGEAGVAPQDGQVSFLYLVPGTYSLDLIRPDSAVIETDPELPLEVTVTGGASEDVRIVVERWTR